MVVRQLPFPPPAVTVLKENPREQQGFCRRDDHGPARVPFRYACGAPIFGSTRTNVRRFAVACPCRSQAQGAGGHSAKRTRVGHFAAVFVPAFCRGGTPVAPYRFVARPCREGVTAFRTHGVARWRNN